MKIKCPYCNIEKEVSFAYENIVYTCEFCGENYTLGWKQEELSFPETVKKEVIMEDDQTT